MEVAGHLELQVGKIICQLSVRYMICILEIAATEFVTNLSWFVCNRPFSIY